MDQRANMLNAAGPVIVLGVAVYCLLCLYLFLMQSRIIYYPNLPGRELQASPADIGLEYETVTIFTQDNIKLHGWFVPSKRDRGVLLFFHGNAGNISHRLFNVELLLQHKLQVFIFDYRGYGKSSGRPSEKGLYTDGLAAYDYLIKERHMLPDQIIIFGRSLGAAVAIEVAFAERDQIHYY